MANVKQKCDFCKKPAIYDAKTILGPWAFVCQEHFNKYCEHIPGLYKMLEPVVEERRTCILCGQEKSISEYYQYTDSRGVVRFRRECKTCNLEQRKRLRFKKDKKEKNNGKKD